MQIKTKFFVRLLLLSFIPFLALSLFSVYIFNRGIDKVISPGFEKTITNAEYMVENSLELYRLRFINLVSILASDSITTDDLRHFDLIIFLSENDTLWLQALSNEKHNDLFIQEALGRAGSFPEIISFEGSIMVYQRILLQPGFSESPILVVGQYLPQDFANRTAEVLKAKTEYSRLKMFVLTSGGDFAWLIWLSVIVIYLTFLIYVARWWANSLIKPINNLSLAAFDIAKGHWGKKVNYNNEDELGMLVNSFNYMSSELENRTRQLVNAEIESSWKNTARVIAHGIKNILSPVKIALHNLSAHEKVAESEAELKTIRAEISRLEDIASDFSMFSRSPEIRKAPVNVKNVAEDAVKLGGRDCENIEKQIDIPGELYVETDYDILRGIMINLVKNACEAIEDAGKVSVTGRRDDDETVIEVTDNGPGIPDVTMMKIWQPYYTTKSRGTGLGLPIAMKFAQALEAELELDSDQQGTTVRIIFPDLHDWKNSTD
ncbi:MAG: HAMP domain-containing protein [candidate division Zixibacteria bacterium]|nr:HAMP domain-containing protein [candidate division Zixibacteria bacterium]